MLPDEVRKAVEYVDQIFDDADNGEWATIKAHPLAREAEVERLNAAWDSSFKQAMLNGQSAQEQRARAERAEALLREVVAVAVTQLFDTHRTDVEATFSLAELQSMVELTEPLMEANTRVEAIYRKAFDFTAHLSENNRN